MTTPLGPWARAAGALAALALAGLALADRAADSRERRDLLDRARRHGAAGAELAALERRLAHESGGGFRRLAVARRLVDRGLELRTEVAARVADGLDTPDADPLAAARDLARAALRRQPASWEGAMLGGAAVALARLAARDTSYFTRWRDWERPLALAAERFPASPLPARYLAAAWLESWPALAPERRPEIAALLAAAFADERFFSLLADRWLELAGSLDAAAALLPDRAASWRRLADAALGDWQLGPYRRFRARARAAERRELAARLDAALAAGGPSLRPALAALLAETPIERSTAPLLDRALARLPPGPAAPPLARAARAWLDWALPLCLVRACPLAPESFARLASLAAAVLPPERDAAAAVAAGDLARAERLALRGQALWSAPWADYLLLAARRSLERGATPEAAALLRQLQAEAAGRLPARLLRHRAGLGSAAPAAERWEPNEWRAGGSVLELLPARAAPGLVVRLHRPAARRALLAVAWDGEPLEPVALETGSSSWRLPGPISAEPHRLVVSVLAGELPAPGVTTLE